MEEIIEYKKETIFNEEEITDDLILSCKEKFKINYLYPWQRIVVENILDSIKNQNLEIEENLKDDIFCRGKQIVLLPTGAGKSLCFLAPALILKGKTLIIYPLLALMTDQLRRIQEGNIKVVLLRGGQNQEERKKIFEDLDNGTKIILANPEVLQNKSLIEKLKTYNIEHLAIDEAHCVSEWGDSFRPAYLKLGEIINELNPPAVTAFTATASPPILERISQILFNGESHIVRSESDRANIHYKVIYTYSKKKTAFLLTVTEQKPLIIFCGTRKKSEDMARELASYYGKEKVKFYHAGLTKEEKEKVEKWFYPKEDAILCCTCAFGMGVDKKDIHTVIHLEASPTAESYIQEAGRGGRDGSIAKAILLWSYEDSIKYENFKKGSRERVLKDFAESTSCRRQVLLDALGGEQTYCMGCDICQEKKLPEYPKDANLILKTIKFNNHKFNEEELSSLLIKKFNLKTYSLTNINIWDKKDCEEIILQLKKEKKIHKNYLLWNNKIAYGKKSKFQIKINSFLQPRLLRLYSFLHYFQKKI